MRPPALIRGPRTKPSVLGVERLVHPRHVGQRREAGIAALRQRPSGPAPTSARLRPVSGTTSQIVPSATRSSQRQQVGLGAGAANMPAPAQRAVERHQQQEGDADRRRAAPSRAHLVAAGSG